ncbi:cilia- and flagella-associated protein 43-like [Melanaphis sacchari]|uniref:cilia- and flagella-associated protein 43-like n=1 Tax=Melanaphis sacchari TaxID=742174 RepID=UPI000DC14DC3|nr:cilia- and flagella-associated protein 43-like [Melanaphis sacchari]
MEFLRTDPKVNEIELITKIVLCDEDLSSVKFFSDGNTISATSFPTGQFFYIDDKVIDLQNIPLDRQLRNIKTYVCENHCIIFSPNGTYSLYEFDDDGQWKKIIMVNCSHWFLGLIAAEFDVNICNILTLSDQGNFVCTSLKGTFNHINRIYKINEPIIVDNFKTKGIGIENELESPKRMTWLMINKENELNASKVAYSNQKNKIIQDFEKIKTKLLHLFETNINKPNCMQINIEEFDLNVDYTLSFKKKCKIERKKYEEKNLGDISNFKIETENIIKEKWETLFIKPKSIYCLKNIYKVDNYSISTIDEEITNKANKIIEKRIFIKDISEQISTEALFFKDNFEVLDVESNSELNYKYNNDVSITGSMSYKLVETIDTLNSQYNYYRLEIAEDEIILLKFMINKLKHRFNQLFDDLFIEKQRQLDNLKEYQDRLIVIETELKLACKVELTGYMPVNFKWNKYEQTETLLYVNDDEVPVELYHSSNIEMSINEEKNSKLLTLDNFKQQALMIMMDGVLEKRWEDELKKDVPKPQCMVLNKNPEEFTADDFKAINVYEKLTLILNDERIKYKNILEEEKIKIYYHIEQIILEFDNNVFMLFQMKLKYNSAINQEHLKILRLSKILNDNDQRKRQIKEYNEIILKSRETIMEIEEIIVETNKSITKTEPTSLLNSIEILDHKSNNLNKRFKSEFPSKLKYEQALIAYNRRPKMHGNKNYSSLLGYQFVDTIMDPTNDKLHNLTTEFVEYLDTLNMYDDYKYVEDFKLNMSNDTWHKVCNFRRMKIETEFNINTCQKHAIDNDYLIENLKYSKKNKETMIEELKISIIRLENQASYYEDNPEIQLVIKQRNVETVLTGNFGDFENTSLISKNTIDEVNTEIKEMGNSKIDTVSSLLRFKCRHRLLEWEYEMLKNHKIQLYTFRFDFITSMKITENMLYYFKFKIKGINITEKAKQNLDKELYAIKFTYLKTKENLKLKLNDLNKVTSKTKMRNKKADEDIGQMKWELNELKRQINFSLNDNLIHHSGEKIKNIMRFAKINKKVLELNKEISELEDEWEQLQLLHGKHPAR